MYPYVEGWREKLLREGGSFYRGTLEGWREEWSVQGRWGKRGENEEFYIGKFGGMEGRMEKDVSFSLGRIEEERKERRILHWASWRDGGKNGG